jgi:small subunit ribosomal protein S8
MSFSDPVSDLLTRIRNAKEAKHRYVELRSSKLIENIVKVMHEKGFVQNYIVDREKRVIRIFLKYASGRSSVINGLKRASKPGLRRYVRVSEIPYVLGGMGISVISTSKGVIDGETARQNKVGGELLCYVW